MKLALALAALAFAPAAFAETEVETLMKQSRAVYTAVESLNAADLSCEAATDCTTFAISHMACGGPADYIVSSKKNVLVKDGTVGTLAAMTESLDKKINELTGAISICIAIAPPQVACQANACVAQSPF